jgi:hypothetical protein
VSDRLKRRDERGVGELGGDRLPDDRSLDLLAVLRRILTKFALTRQFQISCGPWQVGHTNVLYVVVNVLVRGAVYR